ncbi:autotransporter outer membrane beta-barrel domain-containing protein [Acetobacter sicerae]|uniref:hypothetical protein n=1 Tax=Acetobacter sicerae TaxID=85325 RepID=UPI00156AF1D4|nr:hypothetical protein [Acetobacter sicerae]NHN91430.1 hypothetical protein [Acetobacter sicerae]
MPARLVLSAKNYTQTSVQLKVPLTAAQAVQIHIDMYITTNSLNTALSPATAGGTLPARNLYAGFVSAQPKAGDTEIDVYGWDVPTYGTKVVGQIPQTEQSSLDTVFSHYTEPTVFLGGGAAATAFAHNWFFQVNTHDLLPSDTNRSLIRQLTPLEIDLDFTDGSSDPAPPDRSVLWTGINMNAGNKPDALTTNSHQFYMGGVINHHLIIDGGCGNWDLEANGVFIPNAFCGTGTSQAAQISQEWQQRADDTNTMRFVLWNQKGNPDAEGWKSVVSHLGLIVDGSVQQSGSPLADGGSAEGDIEFDQGGLYGGLSLCGYASNCGLTVDGAGAVSIPLQVLQSPKGVNIGTGGVFGLTTKGSSSVQLYPTDAGDWLVGTQVSGGGSIRGLNGIYANSGSFGGTLTASSETISGALTAGSIATTSLNSNGINIGTGQILTTTSKGGYSTQLYANDSGDWIIGTQVAGGANIRGINGMYANSATLESGLTTPKATVSDTLKAGTITTTNLQSSGINIGTGAIYALTSEGTNGAQLYSGDAGDWVVGTQVAGGANLRGVNGFYGNSLTITGTASAVSFMESLTTPVSGHANCTTGQFTDDANYHYVCVAANHWRRVALSDF